MVLQVMTILPFTAAGPILMCCIVYPAAGMREGVGHFFIFMGTVLATMTAAGGLGMLLSTIASDPELANAMAPAFNIIFTVFNGTHSMGGHVYPSIHSSHSPTHLLTSKPYPLGVLINVDDLPKGSKWLAAIGFSRWSFEVRPCLFLFPLSFFFHATPPTYAGPGHQRIPEPAVRLRPDRQSRRLCHERG